MKRTRIKIVWAVLAAGLAVAGLVSALMRGRPGPTGAGSAEPKAPSPGSAAAQARGQPSVVARPRPEAGGAGAGAAEAPGAARLARAELVAAVLDAMLAGSIADMHARLSGLGISLSAGEVRRFVAEAKLAGRDLLAAHGGWNGLLDFWAARRPREALAWAVAHGLHRGTGGPDEAFLLMLQTWAGQEPEAALAYAGESGLAGSVRGRETLGVLRRMNGQTVLLDRFLLLSAAERREAFREVQNMLGYLPPARTGEVITWLLAHRQALDPALVEDMMRYVQARISRAEPDRQMAWLAKLQGTRWYDADIWERAACLARSDFRGAAESVRSLPPGRWRRAFGDVLPRWMTEDPNGAVQWVLALEEPGPFAVAAGEAVRALSGLLSYPYAGAEPLSEDRWQALVERVAAEPGTEALLPTLARAAVYYDVDTAFDILEMVPGTLKLMALGDVVKEWAKIDLPAAMDWVGRQDDPAALRSAFSLVFPETVKQDPDTAVEWVMRVEDPQMWNDGVAKLLQGVSTDEAADIIAELGPGTEDPEMQKVLLTGSVKLGYRDAGVSRRALESVMRCLGVLDPETGSLDGRLWADVDPAVRGAFGDQQRLMVSHLAARDPGLALNWAQAFAPLYLARRDVSAVRHAYARWLQTDPGEARVWLEESSFSDLQREWIRQGLSGGAR